MNQTSNQGLLLLNNPDVGICTIAQGKLGVIKDSFVRIYDFGTQIPRVLSTTDFTLELRREIPVLSTTFPKNQFTNCKMYIMPNISVPENYIGLLLNEDQVGEITALEQVLRESCEFLTDVEFDHIFDNLKVMHERDDEIFEPQYNEGEQPAHPPGQLSEPDFEQQVTSGSTKVRDFLLALAQGVSSYLHHITSFLTRRYITPNEQQKQISPAIMKTAEWANYGSEKVLQFTSWQVEKIKEKSGSIGGKIGRTVGYVSGLIGVRKQASDVVKIGESTARALITVYGGLLDAGRLVQEAASKNFVNAIDHKYGRNAAKLTEVGLGTFHNLTKMNYKLYKIALQSAALNAGQALREGVEGRSSAGRLVQVPSSQSPEIVQRYHDQRFNSPVREPLQPRVVNVIQDYNNPNRELLKGPFTTNTQGNQIPRAVGEPAIVYPPNVYPNPYPNPNATNINPPPFGLSYPTFR